MENKNNTRTSSDLGFYGKEFGYWSVQMESMIGPKQTPSGGSSPVMDCDYDGIVYTDDGGLGLEKFDFASCPICNTLCIKKINAEKSGNIVDVEGCECKAEMIDLSIELEDESPQDCYYEMQVGTGNVYLKISSGSTQSETKSFWAYEGGYPFGS
jgi:hypothetical protein